MISWLTCYCGNHLMKVLIISDTHLSLSITDEKSDFVKRFAGSRSSANSSSIYKSKRQDIVSSFSAWTILELPSTVLIYPWPYLGASKLQYEQVLYQNEALSVKQKYLTYQWRRASKQECEKEVCQNHDGEKRRGPWHPTDQRRVPKFQVVGLLKARKNGGHIRSLLHCTRNSSIWHPIFQKFLIE